MSYADDDASTPPHTPSISVFAPVSAPILSNVDPVEVARFLKNRERYEREILSKQSQVPSLQVLPYIASMDMSLLKNLFFMGKFDEIAPGVTTAPSLLDSHIKTFVLSLVTPQENTQYNPAIIDAALSGFQMDMKIADAAARVTLYCTDFFERLESVGCGSFRENNPTKSIDLLVNRLQPPVLKREMKKRLEYDVSLQKEMNKFIKTLSREAANCQTYACETKDTGRPPSSAGKKTQSREKRGTEGSAPKKLPLCLLPAHKAKGYRHYIKDCKSCPSDFREKLLAEHRAEKNGSAKRTQGPILDKSGVIFSAAFGKKMRTTICADIGADANILGSDMVFDLKKAGVDFTVQSLPTKRFEMAASLPDGKPAFLICNQVAIIDSELHIRHGSALVLRGVRWLVTDQSVGEPLLGRPILEALGLNTREILSAAAENQSGVIDVSKLMNDYSKEGTGRVARILEGVSHAEGGADDTDLNDETGWLDLGPENLREKETVLSEKLQEASDNGSSPRGVQTLESTLLEFNDVIKLKLDGGPAALIEPLRIHLKPDAIPVRTKQRRYPPAKKDFMTRYIRELSNLGFVKKVTSPEWVSAPLIVPKKPPAMYRLTIDYRPINSATIPTFWPMPNIDADLSDTRGATAFAGIDFCSGYWQAPLHPESQPLFAFMTPDGVVMPTRTTQGGCNSAANFQEKVEMCFAEQGMDRRF